jgi:prefoldin subunit 5
MSHAMELIVDGYVKLSGRKALEDLKAHRCHLAEELKSINGALDLSSSIQLLEEEITMIDAGLAKLNTRHQPDH